MNLGTKIIEAVVRSGAIEKAIVLKNGNQIFVWRSNAAEHIEAALEEINEQPPIPMNGPQNTEAVEAPTPETDEQEQAFWQAFESSPVFRNVYISTEQMDPVFDFARRLERERDEARAEAARLREALEKAAHRAGILASRITCSVDEPLPLEAKQIETDARAALAKEGQR